MKELSIEEKAKRYDSAIEKFDVILNLNTVKESGTIFADDVRKIFPELAESEDERIRKGLVKLLNCIAMKEYEDTFCITKEEALAWVEKQGTDISLFPKEQQVFMQKYVSLDKITLIKLLAERDANNAKIIESFEKQGEHANFISKIQVGDKVTRNENGVLVNLSQLNRIAKPIDKVEPKFKIGDWVIDKQDIMHQIANVIENVTYHTYGYDIVGGGYFNDNTEGVRLWTIQDAKDGDVLQLGKVTAIFKEFIDNKYCKCYCSIYNGGFEIPGQEGDDNCYGCGNATPATKEQREQLEKAMAENGYEWDSEMKELKKIEQKPAEWSEEDDEMYKKVETAIDSYYAPFSRDAEEMSEWLESLKDRVQPQPNIEWKPSDEQMKALGVATNISNVPEKEYIELEKLYQGLKKLKEG